MNNGALSTEREWSTAMCNCCKLGHLRVLQWMHNTHPCDSLMMLMHGSLCMEQAFSHGHTDVLEWLMSTYGTKHTCRTFSCPPVSIIQNRDLFDRLAQCHVIGDVSESVKQWFPSLCGSSSVEIVQDIVERFNVTAEDCRRENCKPLRATCMKGNVGVARWITSRFGLGLEAVEQENAQAFMMPCINGHILFAQWVYEQFHMTPDYVTTFIVSECLRKHQLDTLWWCLSKKKSGLASKFISSNLITTMGNTPGRKNDEGALNVAPPTKPKKEKTTTLSCEDIPMNIRVKISLLGDAGVGKTSFCCRFQGKLYPLASPQEQFEKFIDHLNCTILLQDYSEDEYQFRGASFGLLFYDVHSPCDHLQDWITSFAMFSTPELNPELIIIGNKIDCTSCRSQVQTLLDRKVYSTFNISVKTGDGLEELWEYIYTKVVAQLWKKQVESLKEQLFEESERDSARQVDSLKKQLEDEQTAAKQLRTQLTEDVRYEKLSSALKDVTSLKAKNEILAAENTNLKRKLSLSRHKTKQVKERIGQMTSLIPADISDFTPEKLLGTGASAVAFQVGFFGSGFPSNESMVMKVLFNWENTPRHTRLRQKYMAECVILSSMPAHPNVIQPLGALVIPRLPDEFIEQIPPSQTVFREMALNKSLAFIMPLGGIPLSSFLQSLLPSSPKAPPLPPWEMTLKTFQQALKAVNHIEINKIVHRDIKEDNLLVDPVTNTLSLIDFGEATRCPRADLEVTLSSEQQLWGNTGTMPPELNTLARTLRATGTSQFSYSKCDSFALAVTFYDTLLPTDHKFIGSPQNHNMSTFTPAKLMASFPDPLSFFPTPPPSLTTQGSSTATLTSSMTNIQNQIKNVLVRMMAADKETRMSSSDAIQSLSHSLVGGGD
ncbi:hypothetical protein Pelo_9117 [Pelomyxa schiedti]|nr:hypothetical protein Pelo_9117 [Pelomyxa schiedti]